MDRHRQRNTVKRGRSPWSTARFAETGQIRLHALLVRENLQRFPQNSGRTRVIRHNYLVVHPLSLAASDDDAGATEVGEVPRDLGLALSKDLHEVANAHFLAIHEVQKPETGAVGEGSIQ